MRAVCPSASVQLPPAAVTVDLGSAQYCKKFYFFVYFIAVSTGFNFLRNKGSEATCSRREFSCLCAAPVLPHSGNWGLCQRNAGPDARAAVCSVQTSTHAPPLAAQCCLHLTCAAARHAWAGCFRAACLIGAWQGTSLGEQGGGGGVYHHAAAQGWFFLSAPRAAPGSPPLA